MAQITRIGDADTGHDDCPPTGLIAGSGDVFVNGKGTGRAGDSYAPHSCYLHPTHSGSIATGSGSVFVNGRGVGRVGDGVSCGGSVAQGSNNVFAGS